MLSELYIDNIAVIEQTSIVLGQGFNIFTGETGAGKSILIDSINAVLGERTSKDLIRTGANKASVTALFTDISEDAVFKLQELGYEPDEGNTVLISRELTADGRANCRIGGRPATVALLRELGTYLINIHGQHDNQALLDADKHMKFIDSFGNLSADCSCYASQYEQLRTIENRLSKISTDEAEKARRVDLLKFQISEIEEAGLQPDEEDELLAKRKRIKNAARILDGLNTAYDNLSGNEETAGGCSLVANASQALNELSAFLEDVAEMSERIGSITLELEEISNDIHEILDDFEFDPRLIDQIEYRLDTIYKLKKKYGSSVEEVLQYLEKAKQELEEIELSDELINKLTIQRAEVYEKTREAAMLLSAKRNEFATEFARRVKLELEFLDMPSVQLVISNKQGDMRPSGIDNIEFLISTNPGEPPKPLSKIASGGELSRIMLAIKTVLVGKDDVDTMIFDEIDTGVSGRAAQKIGLKLREIARGRQVICVTHLAQIAALGDHHMLIEKKVREGKTYTEVHTLSREQRMQELARIMGGDAITELMLSNADEMLKLAGN
ncbi:DNA repair protein RecN [Acetanaerobacterium elongatum]|uniref:DNA repair protein RecN n=1 Tax=Acetanaerobacterium elongatum TaxID=258515 RepID=A0A1H0APE9_9FIRM|nr:DNA repair protein RecN [Acetanaerobacterium elongatum]SDN35367.1 DNA replication and repair protein RecN [Acetanaerobacterium elongatum]